MTLLRSIARSVKLPDRPPFGTNRGSLAGMGMLSGASAQSGMDAYLGVGAVYGPVRRICEAVSLVNWSLYEQTEKAGTIDRELVDDCVAPARHPATALWLHPNDFMTMRTFSFLTQLWLETANGQCYWLIFNRDSDSPFLTSGLRADLEMWPIRGDKITAVPDPDNYIAGYLYSVGAERIPLPVNAVVPLMYPNPVDPYRGAGPLAAAATDIDTERYGAQYQRNVFINGGEPGGVIQFEQPLAQDRFDELVMRWREQHQGVNNAKRVAIIEGGQWVSTSMNNREMEYSKLRQVTREEIMFALGMPFAMMQSNDVNLANSQMAEKLFYRWTIRPRLEMLKEALNERVVVYLGDNLSYDYDLPAPEDEAFDVFAASSLFRSGLIKRNEAREAAGYDADPEWDGYFTDLPNVAIPPPTMTTPPPPRKPTTLAYGSEPDQQLAAVRAAYRELVASRRNGN